MKPQLSKAERIELGRKINHIRRECNEIFQIVTRCFPKNSRAYKLACSIDKPLVKLYYELDVEVNEYGE